jgi:uncharacterized protein YdhG (YjbR/CyaY superfamily)
MADIKTKKTKASVAAYIAAITDAKKRTDAKALLSIFKHATGMQPALWGTSIIGYGMYHYESERSAQKGDWPLTGFSPRKQNLTVYIMPGFKEYAPLMQKLGKYKTSVSCLYINKLADVDTKVLEQLIKRSVADMKKKHNVK